MVTVWTTKTKKYHSIKYKSSKRYETPSKWDSTDFNNNNHTTLKTKATPPTEYQNETDLSFVQY